MSRRKSSLAGGRAVWLSPARCNRLRHDGDRKRHRATSGSYRSIFRVVCFAAICAAVLVCGLETSRAEEADFSAYARAVEYCRGDVKRPMALDLDKRILCFDGHLLPGLDVSLAKDLEQNGLFVIRSFGGDIPTAIALADSLRDQRATIVVYDYCTSACASYLIMASTITVVMKDTLVAWHYPLDPLWCPTLVAPKDNGPKRLENLPCPDAPSGVQDGDRYRRYLNYKFYGGRAVDPGFDDPPESFTIRKRLRGMFEGTGKYPDVLWTWNPRYNASTLITKIVYEAYPKGQDEIDAMAAKFGLPRVVYDP